MQFDIRMPQLAEVQARLDELFDHVDALHTKIDALTPAAAALGPTPEAPAQPTRRARMSKAPPAPTPAADINGDDIEDEDALRARVEFEAKRTTRQFGIGGTRAAIARVAGGNVLRIDDVPASRLPALLSELRAL